MPRHLHAPLLAGLVATAPALGACNAIFGITGGIPATDGGGTGGGGGGSGFPATPVLDDFNRADGPLGATWSVDTPGGFQVSNDQLVGAPGTPGIMVWPTVFGATQEAYITVVSFDPGDGELELILKNQGMIMECDSLEIDFQPSGAGAGMGMLGVYGCVGNNPMTFGTVPFTLAPGDQLGARARADGKLEVYRNGVVANVIDISTFPHTGSGGRIGFYSSSLVAPAHLDDFGGGTAP